MLEAFPDKPKGMYWETYDRLRHTHDIAERVRTWVSCNLSIACSDGCADLLKDELQSGSTTHA
jgi:hypothetical protein